MSSKASTGTSEFDVVVVGAGFGGLTCAFTAADRGLRVVLLERSELVGGAAAYSGGQVWVPENDVALRAEIDDAVEAALEYVASTGSDAPELQDATLTEEWLTNARLAARYLEEAAGFRWDVIPDYPDYYYPAAQGSLATGRYLTSAPSTLAELGEHAARLRRSPHFPSGLTYGELLSGPDPELLDERRARGVVTFGEGLIAQLFRAVLERGVEVRFGHRAIAPVLASDAVVGVLCETPEGAQTFHGSVVLASSTYEWNPELVQRFYALDGFGSLAPVGLTGDAVLIAEQAGGAVQAFPRHLAPMLPAYRTGPSDDGDPGYRTCREHCFPHSLIVDESGRRFCDDSFYRSIAAAVLGGEGEPRRFFLVWDEQHHAHYGLGATPPGEPYPDDLVSSAPSLPELGRLLGVDGEQLGATVAGFNPPARAGEDPLFGRGTNMSVRRFRGDPRHAPNPVLGTVEKPPFFGMELHLVGTGIGSAGAVTGHSGCVLRADGSVVQGLYAIGPAAAPLHAGASYNSGYTLSRTMTYGFLAATHVADGAVPAASPSVAAIHVEERS